MKNHPQGVKLTLALVLINALIWFGFGLIVLLSLHRALPESRFIRLFYGGIWLAAAAFLVLMAVLLGKPNRAAWVLSVMFFSAGAVVTLFDDFGWIDLLFVLADLAPLVLLVKDRKWYRRKVES